MPPPPLTGGKKLILLALMLASFEGVKGQAPTCLNGNSTTYHCTSYPLSSNHFTLTANVTGGVQPYSITWYQSGGTTISPCCGTGSSTNITALSAGTYTFYYIATGANLLTCTSGTYTVIVTVAEISISGDDLSFFGNPSDFTNYQWYRNGVAIPGATTSTLNNVYYGQYQLKAVPVNCAISARSSNTIDYCPTPPDIVYNASHTFSNTSESNKLLAFNGDFTVPVGVTVTFTNCTLQMGACVKGLVAAGAPIGGSLVLDNCIIYCCGDTWEGIEVDGINSSSTSVQNGSLFTSNGTIILDADLAILAYQNGQIDIDATTFEHNRNHIAFLDSRLSLSGVESSIFSYLSNNPNAVCNAGSTVYANSSSSINRYIFIDNSGNIVVDNCQFTGIRTFPGNQLHAIEIINGNPVGGGPTLTLGGTGFSGDYDYAVNATAGCNGFDMDYCTVTGDIPVGVFIEGGSYVAMRFNAFTCGTAGTSSAIILDQPTYVTIDTNHIYGWTHGMEIYSYTNVANIEVLENIVQNNTYGLVFSPVCNPIGSPTCNNAYVNNGSYNNNISIHCNRFLSNDYGIVGTGFIADQGDATHDWANRFCTSHSMSLGQGICGSGSSSSAADVVWWNSSNPAFDCYFEAGNGANRPLNGLTNPEYLDLNGNTVDVSNYGNQFSTAGMGISFAYMCATTEFDKRDASEDASELNPNSAAKLNGGFIGYPNPASESIYFKQVERNESIRQYQVYDFTGRLVAKGPFTLPIAELSEGVYSILFLNDWGKVGTGRFVKAN